LPQKLSCRPVCIYQKERLPLSM